MPKQTFSLFFFCKSLEFFLKSLAEAEEDIKFVIDTFEINEKYCLYVMFAQASIE